MKNLVAAMEGLCTPLVGGIPNEHNADMYRAIEVIRESHAVHHPDREYDSLPSDALICGFDWQDELRSLCRTMPEDFWGRLWRMLCEVEPNQPPPVNPPPRTSFREDGESNKFVVFDDDGDWLASVQINGEYSRPQQLDMMHGVCEAFHGKLHQTTPQIQENAVLREIPVVPFGSCPPWPQTVTERTQVEKAVAQKVWTTAWGAGFQKVAVFDGEEWFNCNEFEAAWATMSAVDGCTLRFRPSRADETGFYDADFIWGNGNYGFDAISDHHIGSEKWQAVMQEVHEWVDTKEAEFHETGRYNED